MSYSVKEMKTTHPILLALAAIILWSTLALAGSGRRGGEVQAAARAGEDDGVEIGLVTTILLDDEIPDRGALPGVGQVATCRLAPERG